MPSPRKPIPRRSLRLAPQQSYAPGGSSPAQETPAQAASMFSLPLPPPTPQKAVPAYEFLGFLPEAYGTKKLFLTARDPHVLFAYWDLTLAQYLEACRQAHDGKVFLEVYEASSGERVQQLHVWDTHHNWYLQINRPDTSFFAQFGFYRGDGHFEVVARSGTVRTPRATVSPNVNTRFVTIPLLVPFQELYELIAGQVLPGEQLVETLARLQDQDYRFPFPVHSPRPLSENESVELRDLLGDEEIVRRLIGSYEISEILPRRLQGLTSSGQWTSSRAEGVSSLSSPFGAYSGTSFRAFAVPPREFHLKVNAELIIYGSTRPDAKVRVDGHPISLAPDGSFSYHFVFPDGKFHIPIEASSAAGDDTRGALLSFLRITETTGLVEKHPQPPLPEPFGRT